MKLLFVSAVCFVSLFSLQGHAQELQYDVFKGDSYIGTMRVTRQATDSITTRYFIETNVAFRILAEFTVHSTFETFFSDNQLTYAQTLNMLNGKEKESSRVVWSQDRYLCEREGEQTTWNQLIRHSVAQLYFHEPIGLTQTFSERFTENCTIEPGDTPHTYWLHLPNGKENLYTYQKGVCQEVKVEVWLTTLYFKLKSIDTTTATEGGE